MSWDQPDVYYQPEKFGLSIVSQIDDPEASFSFDMIVVWKSDDGRVFWAEDNGCSCPSPFESFTSIESLTLLTDESWKDFEVAVSEWCTYTWDNEGELEGKKGVLRTSILSAAAKALRNKERNGES